ncbi:hypothetical protein BFP97_02730 [Roseivirga sp. 4D4]|uniref:hypothetical protein n=1 Tax=Roseivirga sp. 4D4 TaxID=1889784 RepID=UPI0008538D71|nr:hypothetical protein [Roseivirga sp. 4D4]OEK00490.1 hypothetical protein BFP97_02730 [Roseivirga sp. 4D4]
MSAKDTSYLIEIARQAPTELSRKEVLGFIQTIPTLPPPSNNWFQNFNLNSIIMTTTAIALVTSALIYFSSPTEKLDMEPISPETAIAPDLISDDLDEEPKESIIKLTTIQFEGLQEVVSVETSTEIIPIEPITELQSPDEVVEEVKSIDRGKTSGDPKSVTWSEPETSEPDTDLRVSLDEDQLKSLKRSLQDYIKEDNFNWGKSRFIIIDYTEDNLAINYKTLSEEQKIKYQELLDSYLIKPGPERHLILNKNYIMAGDFTDKGFSGSALGWAMEVNMKKRPVSIRQSKDDLISDGKVTRSVLEIRRLNEPKRTGGYIFQPATPSDAKPKLTRTELRILKRQLLKLLREDNIDQSGISDFSTLWFTADFLKLNNTELKGEMYSRYATVIKSFHIKPAPERRVVINNDFIQVGDYTDKGFDGQALGKHMEIYFIDDPKGKKGLFSEDSNTGKSIMEDADDDTILKTNGEFKKSEVNLSKVDRILKSQGDAPPKDGNRFYDSGKEAISIYTKETERTLIELNGEQLRSLKKELYRELQKDDLIESRRDDVRLLFDEDDILVNDIKLTGQMTFKYKGFLGKYGIESAEMRKVLMCLDFIVVGDFIKGNFQGSLQGSLNSQDIRESIFKQDFKDFPVFGFDKAMKDK